MRRPSPQTRALNGDSTGISSSGRFCAGAAVSCVVGGMRTSGGTYRRLPASSGPVVQAVRRADRADTPTKSRNISDKRVRVGGMTALRKRPQGRPSLGERRLISAPILIEVAERIERLSQLSRTSMSTIISDLVVRHSSEIDPSAPWESPEPHIGHEGRRAIPSRIPVDVADLIDRQSRASGRAMGRIVADLVERHSSEIDPDPLEVGAAQPRLVFEEATRRTA